jgi:hypothetical protein
MPGKLVVDFDVPWHRLFLSSRRIVEDVVSCAAPEEDAARLCQLAHQGGAFHTAIFFTW